MVNVSQLQHMLSDTTQVLSKGAITGRYLEHLDIPEVLWKAFPFEGIWPSKPFDCHFVSIGVVPSMAERYRQQFRELVEALPDQELLGQGPSYRHFIHYTGSELNALRFLVLGRFFGLWNIVTPEQGPDIPKEQYAGLALMGLICMTGYAPVTAARAAVS